MKTTPTQSLPLPGRVSISPEMQRLPEKLLRAMKYPSDDNDSFSPRITLAKDNGGHILYRIYLGILGEAWTKTIQDGKPTWTRAHLRTISYTIDDADGKTLLYGFSVSLCEGDEYETMTFSLPLIDPIGKTLIGEGYDRSLRMEESFICHFYYICPIPYCRDIAFGHVTKRVTSIGLYQMETSFLKGKESDYNIKAPYAPGGQPWTWNTLSSAHFPLSMYHCNHAME